MNMISSESGFSSSLFSRGQGVDYTFSRQYEMMWARPLKSAMLDSRLVFLDLETTGASANRDRITEIGLIEVADG